MITGGLGMQNGGMVTGGLGSQTAVVAPPLFIVVTGDRVRSAAIANESIRYAD